MVLSLIERSKSLISKSINVVEINPDNILIVPGGKVTMWHSILMFGGKNKEIIYPNPGFPIYESVINYTGAKAVPMILEDKTDFNKFIDLDLPIA